MTAEFWRFAAMGVATAACALLAGCDDSMLEQGPYRAQQPLSSATLDEMNKLGTTPDSPVLIRTYKKEAELEIWKMKSDGHYALLKTYPMCRWSGQLGPKTHEGDRQVPEGFYPITPGQMNPNSNYYLSFNVGYPNAYDRAFGRTGGNIMVHGVCSSAGCFSMTDAEIADIYTIAREAFRGGQNEIQMQSYPFHMTAENLAKYRLDPNIAFWKQLKNGSDHFEVTKTEPTVVVCAKHYVFGAQAEGEVSATAACPKLESDPDVESLVAAKESADDSQVAELVASGVKPIHTVYEDGGQNPAFAGVDGVSDPDALEAQPTDVALDDHGKPIPVVKVAAADAAKIDATKLDATKIDATKTGSTKLDAKKPDALVAAAPKPAAADSAVALAPAPQTAPTQSDASGGPIDFLGHVGAGGGDLVKSWFSGGNNAPANAAPAFEPSAPIPANVPLPPRRDTAAEAAPVKMVRFAALHVAPEKGKPLDINAAATAPAQ
jgi:murein L,D-transpeptidase YafK